MSTNEFKYYILKRKDDQAYPLLRIADEDYNEERKTIKVYLELNSPNRKPVLADFLYAPKDIVSKRIAAAMQELNMEGVQFIPTELALPKREIIEDYICVIVNNNTYQALDKEKAIFTKDKDFDIWSVRKIVLDHKILGDIPLNKRLGFRLKEAPGYYLYHQSVIDVISALNPTGVYFQNIEEYKGLV